VGASAAVAPPKSVAPKPILTTYGLKRYLANVGQKTEPRALFRIVVRINYLFSHISEAEMTPILIKWCKRTDSPFDQAQIRQMVLDAKQRVLKHSSKRD